MGLVSNTRQLTSSCAWCRAAVQAFCSSVQCGLGGSGSVAMGPLGRQADAGLKLGTAGSAMVHSYSASRGAFAGAFSQALLYVPCMLFTFEGGVKALQHREVAGETGMLQEMASGPCLG